MLTVCLILCLLSLPLNGAFLVVNSEDGDNGLAAINVAAIVLSLVAVALAIV